jgi:hypothetical protein
MVSDPSPVAGLPAAAGRPAGRRQACVRADVAWPVLLVLLATVLILAALLIVVEHRVSELEDGIDLACSGVVARLDLTEWVTLCRTGR